MSEEIEAYAGCKLPKFMSISGREVIKNPVQLDKTKIRNGVKLLVNGPIS